MIRALAITGPTASGKTALSLAVAESVGAEIISLDSMQIYRRMDIGTSKATPDERARVPHYMLDILSPKEAFSAEDYRRLSLPIARDIEARGKIPLFVGGTGLYLDTLMRGAAEDAPPRDAALTEMLMREGESEEGRERLYGRLLSVDPLSAEKMHKNNLRRVVRALEVYELTGIPKSELDMRTREAPRDISLGVITLDFHNRESLYRRVDTRVDKMMSEGLLSEVSSLLTEGLLSPDSTAGQAIGYKELFGHLRGETSLEEAVELIKLSTRRYAKRQLTWFRHTDAARLFVDTEAGDMKNEGELLSEALYIVENLL